MFAIEFLCFKQTLSSDAPNCLYSIASTAKPGGVCVRKSGAENIWGAVRNRVGGKRSKRQRTPRRVINSRGVRGPRVRGPILAVGWVRGGRARHTCARALRCPSVRTCPWRRTGRAGVASRSVMFCVYGLDSSVMRGTWRDPTARDSSKITG